MDERQDAKDAKRRHAKKSSLTLLSYLGVLGVLAFIPLYETSSINPRVPSVKSPHPSPPPGYRERGKCQLAF
jgi:hypothetical protein